MSAKQDVINEEVFGTDTDDALKYGCYFNDGVRRVDYVLVWEETLSTNSDDSYEDQSAELSKYRARFEKHLLRADMELEKETSITSKKKINFVKLHVTWKAMCYFAEYLRLRAPLRVLSKPTVPDCQLCLVRNNPLRQLVPNQPEAYYTCSFTSSKMQNFLGIDQQDTYFKPTQRHLVAHEILSTRLYGQERLCEIGIDRMIKLGIYDGAFPPHEGPWKIPKNFNIKLDIRRQSSLFDKRVQGLEYDENDCIDEEDELAPKLYVSLNLRQVLRAYWASWCLWYKYQPLDHVQSYFGEAIAFYFAWLGMYTAWLMPAALAGILVSVLSVIFLLEDDSTREACNSGQSLRMCPFCDIKDGCDIWHLSDVCIKIKLANMFDSPLTAVYATFASLWAVLFLEFWKRRNAELALRWGVTTFYDEDARPRPGFAINCSEFRQDPITGELEPHFSPTRRLQRMAVSYVCLALMMVVVAVCISGIIVFQSIIAIHFFRMPLFRSRAKTIAAGAAAGINLIVLLILELIYEKMAYKLTEWEMHPTQWKFDDQLIIKLFIFDVWNYYSSILYTAFLKGRFTSAPGNYNATTLGFRLEDCDEGGCLFDLLVILAIIMIGKQIVLTVFVDLIIPKICKHIYLIKLGLYQPTKFDNIKLTQFEADHSLLPHEGLTTHYRELMLQFGYTTIFAPVFPLAPLFAIIRSCFKIRMDARTLVLGSQRPLAQRAQGIGVWFQLLELIATAGVFVNSFLIAFTSNLLPKLLYKHGGGKGNLHGFFNYTLAWSSFNESLEPCRYRDYQKANGSSYSEYYWKLLMSQLAFVIAFQSIVQILRWIIMALIPSVPRGVRNDIKRQGHLGKRALVVESFADLQISHRLTDESIKSQMLLLDPEYDGEKENRMRNSQQQQQQQLHF